MMKLKYSLNLLAIFALFVQINCEAEKRLCVDEDCKGIISLGKTIKNYAAGQEGILSFKANVDVKIKSKLRNSDYWGVEIDGKDGYAPKQFLQEQKVFVSTDSLKEGVPMIAPPIKAGKLKGSEKEKPVFESTTTSPLPSSVENEKILSKANKKQTPNDNPIKFTTTTNVIDGTVIPSHPTEPSLETMDIYMKGDLADANGEEEKDNKEENSVETTTAIPSKLLPINTKPTETSNLNIHENLPKTEKNISDVQSIFDNSKSESQKPGYPLKKDLGLNATVDSNQIINKTENSKEHYSQKPNNAMEDSIKSQTTIADSNQTVQQTTKNTQIESENPSNPTDEPIQISDPLTVNSKEYDSQNHNNAKEESFKSQTTIADSNQTVQQTTKNTQIESETPSNPTEEPIQISDPVTNSTQTKTNHIESGSDKTGKPAVNDPLQTFQNDDSTNLKVKSEATESIKETISKNDKNLSIDEARVISEPSQKTNSNSDSLKTESNENQDVKALPLKTEEISQILKDDPETLNVTEDQNKNNIESETKDDSEYMDGDMKVIHRGDGSTVKLLSQARTNQKFASQPENVISANYQGIHPNVQNRLATSATGEIPSAVSSTLMEQQSLNSERGSSLVNQKIASVPIQYQNTPSNLNKQQPYQHESNTPFVPENAIPPFQNVKQEFTGTASIPTTNARVQDLPAINSMKNELNSATLVNGLSSKASVKLENNQQPVNADSTQPIASSSIETPQTTVPATPNFETQPMHNLNSGNTLPYQETSNPSNMPSPKQTIESSSSSYSQISKNAQEAPEGLPYQTLSSKKLLENRLNDMLPPNEIVEHKQKFDHPSGNENVPSEVENSPDPPAPKKLPIIEETMNDQNVTTNDVKLENEDVTARVPTTLEFDDPLQNPSEIDVTTPNPGLSHVHPPPQQPQVGLFQTILGTVKGLLPSQEPSKEAFEFSNELNKILFPKKEAQISHKNINENEQYCERDDNCPTIESEDLPVHDKFFFESLSERVIELFDVLCCMLISATATLLFIFGYYCLSQCRKESQLIAKLNVVERSLLASHKESSILKHDLGETCDKLASIENNSFGSNDMVIAIKKELEICEEAKSRLEDQVVSLEKELENAAEAGLELNKIVSELLNNQSGDDSIISSVEELQKQLNEQQHTILEINAVLADKSRENSELQLILAEQNAKFVGEIASLQQDNDELEGEKNILQSKIDELKAEFDLDITKALEGKNAEIKRLQADIVALRKRCDEEHRKWQTSTAKIEALENCLKSVKRDPSLKVSQIIDVANVQAELLDIQRQRSSLKEKLETETDVRKLLEEQVKSYSDEIEKLKQDFNQSEKDKLEAQTRLEVLSNYFKDKENQLQKELSLKETMWLQQQGETTSTVDRLTNMQEEIQTLKSQNDSLRAEIEAQLAAHKAQIGTLENRAHETWLAARQSERRYEEARSDATALRRKLTSIVGSNGHSLNKENNLDLNLPPSDLNNAPSPIHMDSPASPMLGRLPPPPFIAPPFMGPPPPHFMGIPPFMPPVEMRPPPMGRLMSPQPPPTSGRMHRYTASDDDDDEDDINENSRGRWRDTYSPPRHSYRYSPDRYIYNPEIISNYDTETDFSPPPSPRDRSHRSGSRSGSYKAYSPPPQSSNSQSKDRPKKSSKGQISSESEKSYDSWKGKSKAMV